MTRRLERYNTTRLLEVTATTVRVWEEGKVIAEYSHNDDVDLDNIQGIMEYDYENTPYQEFDPVI